MKQFILYLLLGMPVLLLAQKPFYKKDVSIEDLELASCSFYPEAQSMILGKFGELSVLYTEGKGFIYQLKVTVRKKIFEKGDEDAGNIKIYLNSSKNGRQEEIIKNVKAYTYNLVDGDIEKTKMGKDALFQTQVSDYLKEVSFALPNIQAGSVLEYSYQINSEYLVNLQTWYFQEDVPIAFNRFIYQIPEYLNYQINQLGQYIRLEDEKKLTTVTYNVSFTDVRTQRRILTAVNVPPVENEPYMNNWVDVPSRIKFQLISINFPGQLEEKIAGNYQQFNQDLMEAESFGRRINKNGLAPSLITPLSNLSETDKAIRILTYIQKKLSWNSYSSFTSGANGKEVLKKGSGSAGEINLTMIALMREAGLKANPVVLSTRGNGIVHPVYPNYQDFNYVVAAVEIDGQQYLADGACSHPLGLLPERCLNGKGWMVGNKQGTWIAMKSNLLYKTRYFFETSLAEENIQTAVRYKAEDYGAIDCMLDFGEQGEDDYALAIKDRYENWETGAVELEVPEKLKDGFGYQLQMTSPIEDEDLIYLTTFPEGVVTENPFKNETRFSMIDLPYGYQKRAVTKIVIPEGYEVDFPESMKISLPGDAGSFTFRSNLGGQDLMLQSSFKMTKKEFTPEEYEALRAFYEMMVEKNTEMVVLKKKT